jgi:rod shape determining protein RodA
MQIQAQQPRYFDRTLVVLVMTLMAFGVIAIWSATGEQSFTFSNLGVRQAVFGAVGLVLMYVLSRFDYRMLTALTWILYAASVVLLVAVLFIGVVIAGSQRWIDVGFTTVQPSEFGKLATLLALSSFVSSRGKEMEKFSNFVVTLLIVALPAGLVYVEPDLGSTLCYGAVWLGVMAVTQTRVRYFVLMAILAAPAFLFAWEFVFQDYMKDRLLISYDPYSDPTNQGFNIIQARISIGSGGWTGFGLLGGTQSTLGLLRVRTTDFIFSHAAGMFGFIGMLALLTVFAMMIWRCASSVNDTRDTFGRTFAMGLTGLLFFQTFVNIGMNIGVMPVTGITLPFISSGSSSLWTFLAAIGILQNIRRRQMALGFQPD